MSKLKKFLIVFLSFMPFTAGAIAPLVIGLIAGAIAITGMSIYRSFSPVDMNESLQFFSSCWTCDMFSSVMTQISNVLPILYSNIAKVVIPFAFALTAVYFAWVIFSSFFNQKLKDSIGYGYDFGKHLFKLSIVCILLLAPLPRLVNDVIIDPLFGVGMTMNHVLDNDNKYTECVVSTVLLEKNHENTASAIVPSEHGAFSTKLRSGLACELANVHIITGTGITVGWAMLNMAFNYDYMHKILWKIPIFPNIPLMLCGFLIVALFLIALFPIPFYFLEVFITLALDLIMLPLLLLSWLFEGWKFIDLKSTKKFSNIIDSVISGVVGISMTIIFLTFASKFLEVIAGSVGGFSRIQEAFAQNDSRILIDGLLLRNDSLLTILMLGLFFAIFMSSIPALIKSLFNFTVSDKFYQSAKSDVKLLGKKLGNWWTSLKKQKIK